MRRAQGSRRTKAGRQTQSDVTIRNSLKSRKPSNASEATPKPDDAQTKDKTILLVTNDTGKYQHIKRALSSTGTDAATVNAELHDSIQYHYDDDEDKSTVMIGYASTSLGRLCLWSCGFLSLLWLFVLVLVYWDYYEGCEFTGMDNLCFLGLYNLFGSYDPNSEVMFYTWLVGVFWFGMLLLKPEEIMTYCLIPVPLHKVCRCCSV
jgi:hypothetical protein